MGFVWPILRGVIETRVRLWAKVIFFLYFLFLSHVLLVLFVTKEGEKRWTMNPATEPPPPILRLRCVWSSSPSERKDRNPPLIETHHWSKPTTNRNPPPIEPHHQGRWLSRSTRCLLRLLSSSPSVEGSKPTTIVRLPLFRSSVFSRLLASARHMASPTSSLGPDGVSFVASRLRRQKDHARSVRRRVSGSSRRLRRRSFSSGSWSLQFGDHFPSNKLSHLIFLSISVILSIHRQIIYVANLECSLALYFS